MHKWDFLRVKWEYVPVYSAPIASSTLHTLNIIVIKTSFHNGTGREPVSEKHREMENELMSRVAAPIWENYVLNIKK